MHLAQLNVAKLRYPIDDPRIADFADNLDRINGLAETMPGFVWRYVQDCTDAGTDAGAFGDPDVISTLSVWQSPEALERFVFRTIHKKFYQRRAEWFAALAEHHMVLWWVDEGHRPDVDEAEDRLRHLRRNGPGTYAFGWESVKSDTAWAEARCA